MTVIRRRWMTEMAVREVALLDGQLLGHAINSASFFASSNLILIAAAAGVLFGGDSAWKSVEGLAVLAKTGFRLEQVDTLILTHLHFDHAGNFAAFPNARLIVQRREYERWLEVIASVPDLSLGKLRDFRRLLGNRLPLIGVGGIANAEQAYARIRAGASLVQVYSALVYEGPYLARRINDGLKALMARDGVRHIGDVVGIDA